jgi:hypothetical protein
MKKNRTAEHAETAEFFLLRTENAYHSADMGSPLRPPGSLRISLFFGQSRSISLLIPGGLRQEEEKRRRRAQRSFSMSFMGFLASRETSERSPLYP